jgi:hypothetical protein
MRQGKQGNAGKDGRPGKDGKDATYLSGSGPGDNHWAREIAEKLLVANAEATKRSGDQAERANIRLTQVQYYDSFISLTRIIPASHIISSLSSLPSQPSSWRAATRRRLKPPPRPPP